MLKNIIMASLVGSSAGVVISGSSHPSFLVSSSFRFGSGEFTQPLPAQFLQITEHRSPAFLQLLQPPVVHPVAHLQLTICSRVSGAASMTVVIGTRPVNRFSLYRRLNIFIFIKSNIV